MNFHGKSAVWIAGLVLATAAMACAGVRPVAFRLASLPASTEPGQKLMLCAANIGTGNLDVTLEFINVKTGGVMAEKTVHLEPLGAGAATQPCLTTGTEAALIPQAGAAHEGGAMGFAAGNATTPLSDRQALVVGVAMVRKPIFTLREAQVTASIQVMAPDADGSMRTVQTIPLSRTTHPADGAPVYVPAATSSGHHK